jgi:hypothetical protein
MSLTGFGFSDSAALLKHFKYGPRHLLQLTPLRPFDAGVLIAQFTCRFAGGTPKS